ncbi:MAG: sigma-70 family RNA polymerase sigma factor [Alphaproteobacteria bacterium]
MASDVTGEIELLIPRLRAYARVMTRDHDRADDLVQTCLERALRSINQFTVGTNLRAWLFTILRHAHINEVRRQAKWAGSLDSSECEDLFPVGAPQEKSIEFRDLHRAFSRLSAPDRSVLALVGAEGMSYQDAAETLDVPIGTIRSRLSRARNRLRDLMEDGIDPSAARSAERSTGSIH